MSFNIPLEKEIFSDNDVTLREVVLNKEKRDILVGKLSMSKQDIILTQGNEKRSFLMSEIYSIALLSQNKVNFYIGNKIFQLKSNKRFNGLKYMHLYHIIRMERTGIKNGFLGI